MKPGIKAPLIGVVFESVLISPMVIGGWGHGIPASVLGWFPYFLHAPAYMLFTYLGLRDTGAAAASVIMMTFLWSLLAFYLVRPNKDRDRAT